MIFALFGIIAILLVFIVFSAASRSERTNKFIWPFALCFVSLLVLINKIDCSNRLKGDFNNDGQVNVADLVFLQKYLNNDKNKIDIVNNDECFLEIGDLNGDGQINVADLVFLQKYLNNDPNFKI